MGNQVLQKDFNEYFESRMRIGSKIGRISIYHSASENFSRIQLADLMSSVVYQKSNNHDSSYLDLIDP